MDELGVPPGKYFPFVRPLPPSLERPSPVETQIRRYQYGSLAYPSFVTSGDYSGQVLLHSIAGVVAGQHRYQKGSVLFVNLPLGLSQGQYRWPSAACVSEIFRRRTRSRCPICSPCPTALGDLCSNWHVDSNAAIYVASGYGLVDDRAARAIFHRHHGRAGHLRDWRQQRIRCSAQSRQSGPRSHKYAGRGDEIGSHGGWIHNYFAAHVETDPPKDMVKFLELNKARSRKSNGKAGRRVLRTEWRSAPVGYSMARDAWLPCVLLHGRRRHGTHAGLSRRPAHRDKTSGLFPSLSWTGPPPSKSSAPRMFPSRSSSSGSRR